MEVDQDSLSEGRESATSLRIVLSLTASPHSYFSLPASLTPCFYFYFSCNININKSIMINNDDCKSK